MVLSVMSPWKQWRCSTGQQGGKVLHLYRDVKRKETGVPRQQTWLKKGTELWRMQTMLWSVKSCLEKYDICNRSMERRKRVLGLQKQSWMIETVRHGLQQITACHRNQDCKHCAKPTKKLSHWSTVATGWHTSSLARNSEKPKGFQQSGSKANWQKSLDGAMEGKVTIKWKERWQWPDEVVTVWLMGECTHNSLRELKNWLNTCRQQGKGSWDIMRQRCNIRPFWSDGHRTQGEGEALQGGDQFVKGDIGTELWRCPL